MLETNYKAVEIYFNRQLFMIWSCDHQSEIIKSLYFIAKGCEQWFAE